MKLWAANLVMIAATSHAQWSIDLFRSSPEYRFGYNSERVAEMTEAIDERADWAMPDNYFIYGYTATMFGATRSLRYLKSDISGFAASWADRNEMSAGTFDAWFSSTNVFPELTETLLITYSGSPTNWFDSTPWFGSATHSNGWEYVDEVLNEIVVGYSETQPTSKIWPYKWYYDRADGASFLTATNTWEGAKYLAEQDYTQYTTVTNTSGAVTAPQTWTESYYLDAEEEYEAYFRTERVKLFLTNALPTSVDVGVYVKVTEPTLDPWFIDLDVYTMGFSTNWQTVIYTNIPANGTVETDWIGEWWPDGASVDWGRAATTNDYDAGSSYRYGIGYEVDSWTRWHFDFEDYYDYTD